MVTIYDIAREADVSIAAVSLVVNDPESKRVGFETRARIRRVAKAMGYLPNAAAKALTEGKTRIIGLVIPMREPIFINPFIAEVLAGVQATLMERGYHLMIYSHGSATGRLTPSELNHSRQVDGVIVVNTRMCTQADMDNTITSLSRSSVPFVMVNGYEGKKRINYVGTSDDDAGFLATEYLIKNGHKRIAILCGQATSPISKRLLAGYLRAHDDHHIDPPPSFRFDTDYDLVETRKKLDKWLQANRRPTAIFAADDHLVATVFAAARDHALRVPADLSIVARGTAAGVASLGSSVTMVTVPAMEIGRKAGQVLIDQLLQPKRKPEKIMLTCSIKRGESA